MDKNQLKILIDVTKEQLSILSKLNKSNNSIETINKLSNEILNLLNDQLLLCKEERKNRDNSGGDSNNNNNNNNNNDNDILFWKIWNNLVIRNVIFQQKRLLSNHFNGRTFKFKNHKHGITGLDKITKYHYNQYLQNILIFMKFKKPVHVESIFKYLQNLPENINTLQLANINYYGGDGDDDEHTEIYIDSMEPINIQIVPSSITNLKLFDKFNSALGPNAIPSSIKSLEFGFEFNRPLYNKYIINNGTSNLIAFQTILPKPLTSLNMYNSKFNHPILPGTLPESLTYLSLCHFNCQLLVGSLPESLITLHLGVSYDHRLTVGVLPSKLEYLEISSYYSHPFDEIGILPESLKTLIFDYSSLYDHPIVPDTFPKGLVKLELGCHFDQSLENLPSGLKELTIGSFPDIFYSTIPKSIEKLEIQHYEYNILLNGNWCDNLDGISLKKLKISNQISILSIPSSLTKLEGFTLSEVDQEFQEEYDTTVTIVNYEKQLSLLTNSPNIKSLSLYCQINKELKVGDIPKQIVELSLPNYERQLNPMVLQQCIELHTISFGFTFQSPILPNTFPDSLKTLILDTRYNIPFEIGSLPKGLEHLSIRGYDIQLELSNFNTQTPNLKTMEFGFDCEQTLTKDNLPPLIETLIIWGFTTEIQLPIPDSLKEIYVYSLNTSILNNIPLFNQLSHLIRVLNSNQMNKLFKKHSKSTL